MLVSKSTRFHVNRIIQNCYHTQGLILGIESSCDDTSLAIVNVNDGNIIAQSHSSQVAFHSLSGGINPIFARDLHLTNVKPTLISLLSSWTQSDSETVWDSAIKSRIKAIAVTTRPGLPLSLEVGIDLAKQLASNYDIPNLIPIHHMEAHALTIRGWDKGQTTFPYLCLLISGGHCILTWVQNPIDFSILGTTLDIAPGDAFDKMARKLGLNYHQTYSNMSGGQAIDNFVQEYTRLNEELPNLNNMKIPLSHTRTCNFSFNGILSNHSNILDKNLHPLQADSYLDGQNNFKLKASVARAFQSTVADHIAQSTRRAMLFCETRIERQEKLNALPSTLTLAIAGGVACNSAIRSCLSVLCRAWGWRLMLLPPNLCTDNGVMVAWNALERLRHFGGHFEKLGRSIALEDFDIKGKCAFGKDLTNSVKDANISASDIRSRESLKPIDTHIVEKAQIGHIL